MLACSSGSMTPGEHAADVVGRRRWPGEGLVDRGARVVGVRSAHHAVDKTRLHLENMPDRKVPSSREPRSDLLAVLKALGDETRYAMYRRAGRARPPPLSAPELAERLGLHANTVRLHLERLREVGLVDVEAVHRGTVGRPQHLYFAAPPVRPGSGSTRRRTRCSPACSPRSPSGSAPTPTRPPTTGPGVGEPRPAGAPGRARCLKALEVGAGRLGFEPGAGVGRRRRTRPASSSCTARSGSWPRPTRSWCATSTGASARAWSTRSAGEESRSSRRCTTADPCQVTVGVGYPDPDSSSTS